MSENINEILNVSDTEVEKKDELSLSEEKTLKTIADIVLVVGIISSVILLFTITIINVGEYSWENEFKFSASGLVNTLGVLFSSIAIWALLRVISNISISLKELNRKNSVE